MHINDMSTTNVNDM